MRYMTPEAGTGPPVFREGVATIVGFIATATGDSQPSLKKAFVLDEVIGKLTKYPGSLNVLHPIPEDFAVNGEYIEE